MERCVPGQRDPYLPSPPPTVTQNISFPFTVQEYPAWEVGLKVTACIVAMAMATIGNAAVLLTVLFNRHRLVTVSMTLYLANLAISDFMVGAFVMWIHLASGIQENWPFGPTLCKVYPFLQIFFLSASVLFMATISVDRLFAILLPLKWRLVKLRFHIFVTAWNWILSATVAVPILLVREWFELYWADRHQVWCTEQWPQYARLDQGNSTTGCKYDYPDRQIYYNCLVVLMYFIPILIMIVTYGIILYRIKDRKIPGQQTDNVVAQQKLTTRKAIRMLIAVFAAFVVCWTPQEVIVFMDANWPDYTTKLSDDLRYSMIFIAYLNSSVNPIIYAGLNERVRSGFKETFCQWNRRKIMPSSPVRDTKNGDQDDNGSSSSRSSSSSSSRRSTDKETQSNHVIL